jgi:hypothetical protein
VSKYGDFGRANRLGGDSEVIRRLFEIEQLSICIVDIPDTSFWFSKNGVDAVDLIVGFSLAR